MKWSFVVPISAVALVACQNHHKTAFLTGSKFATDHCGGYPQGWRPRGAENGELTIYNKVLLEASGLKWNGVYIDNRTLQKYLSQIEKMETILVTAAAIDDNVGCDQVNHLRKIMNAFGSCNSTGSCVEYSSTDWSKAHPPLPY